MSSSPEYLASPTRSILLPQGAEQLLVRRASLRVEEGPDKGLEVTLPEGPWVLGRGEEADLRLDDPAVSRSHVRIYPTREGWRLKDLGSKTGTWVGDLQVDAAVLGEDHLLRVGETKLRFRLSEELFVLTPPEGEDFEGMAGKSPAMRRLFSLVERVGPLDLPVLIHGESGTGKEGLARALHQRSPRAKAPYVVVDCTMLGGEHLRSELFGHVKGAFTGAVDHRVGAFERADGGTLFLDEIAEVPLDLQPMLLRALELGEFTPLGGSKAFQTRVRVVAATHRSLPELVAAGSFREDLYYRLAGIELAVPPLRDRSGDVALLARRFASGRAEFSPEAISALTAHGWPGNVRELRNVVERAVALCHEGRVEAADLNLRVAVAEAGASSPGGEAPEAPRRAAVDPSETLAETEVRKIQEALDRHNGNRSAAAAELGINRVTLWRKIKRLGLEA